MFLLINIIGLIVFLGIAVLFSRDRKNIQWQSIGILVVLNLFLAWFFIYFDWGQKAVRGAANGIAWVSSVSACWYRFCICKFDKC
ncbi:Pyrimidine nucleoside transporter [Staphylococcus aureus]|nr:Pyrimidine nucleoside transporter [Staphylococcus aureus]